MIRIYWLLKHINFLLSRSNNSGEYNQFYMWNTFRNDTYKRIEQDFDEYTSKKGKNIEKMNREIETKLSDKMKNDILHLLYAKGRSYEERCEIIEYIDAITDKSYRRLNIRPRVLRKHNGVFEAEDKKIGTGRRIQVSDKEIRNLKTRDCILSALIAESDAMFECELEL